MKNGIAKKCLVWLAVCAALQLPSPGFATMPSTGIHTRYDGQEREDFTGEMKAEALLPNMWVYQYVDTAKQLGTYRFVCTCVGEADSGRTRPYYTQPIRLLRWVPSKVRRVSGPFFKTRYQGPFEDIPTSTATNELAADYYWLHVTHSLVAPYGVGHDLNYVIPANADTWTPEWVDVWGEGLGHQSDGITAHYAWTTYYYPFIKYVGPYSCASNATLKEVTIPEGVTHIEEGAFAMCTALTNVVFPSTLESIGPQAFRGCTALAEITIPEGVTTIGAEAFKWCSNLTSVTVPPSVTEIGRFAFEECPNLVAVHTRDIDSWCRMPHDRWSNPLVYAHHLFIDGEEVVEVAFPDGMTSINAAFAGCSGLARVSIPAGVTSIGDSAFSMCTNLVAVAIPPGVTNIGSGAFEECSGLASLLIPDGVETIGEYAFSGCSGLATLTLPDGLKEVSYAMCEGCTGLTSIAIPDSVIDVWPYAFADCTGLTSVEIPGSVESVEGNMFRGCTGLQEVFIRDGVSSIAWAAFNGCINLKSVSIPDSVVEIGVNAFSGCNAALFDSETVAGTRLVDGWLVDATESISGELDLAGIRGIADNAFSGCTNLTSVAIPEGASCIGDRAFGGCTGLESVSIPDSVKQIGSSAFSGCAETFFDFASMPGLKLVDGWLIGWTGSLAGAVDLTGIRGIAEEAFFNCTNLAAVTIPANVTRIGDYAFGGCRGLTSVSIPDSVTSIGNYAFARCLGLTSVGIPDGVTSIGHGAFSDCSGLEELTLPPSVTSFGNNVFAGCNSLKTLYVPVSWWGTGMMEQFWVPAGCEIVYYGDSPAAQRVTFDPNGGKCGTATREYPLPGTYGELPTATRSGQAFLGWFTAAAGGEAVTAEDVVTVEAERTLWAHWTNRQVTTFNGNGGKPAALATTNTIYADYGTLPEAKWSGHAFLGWFNQPEGGKRVYTNSTVTLAATRTLYAQWTDQQVTTFKANGGYPATQKTTNTIYEAYAAFPAVKYSGHALVGWFNAPEGGKRIYTNSTATLAATRTLYAQWTTNQVTTFKGNGGTPEIQKTTNAIYTHYGTLPEAVWENHVFLGWFNHPTKGKRVYTNTTVTLAATRSLYAHWTDKQVVTFKGNGGSPTTAKTTNTMGKAYGPLPTPKKSGHALLGWFTAADGGDEVTAEDLVTAATSRTLYAHWTNRQVTTFLGNGGTPETQATTNTIYAKYAFPPAPTWEGHAFQGWYNAEKGGKQVYTNSTVTLAATRTLYAHWTTAKGFAIIAIAVGADEGDEGPAPRAVRGENKAEKVCRLRFELSAGTEYEIQWTASMAGGWETVERLAAETDGEVEVEIEVPGGEKGFFRLVAFGEAGEAD